MKSVFTEVGTDYTKKYSTDKSGYSRLTKEIAVYRYLKQSAHIPKLVDEHLSGTAAFMKIETIKGTSLIELIETCHSEHMVGNIKPYLKQYIDAEMDLLKRGALYRDLNFDHIIFTGQSAYFIDLESTIIKNNSRQWVLNDMRGTWETMAPEEFRGFGILDARTATYRAAVVAHVMLTGALPFDASLKTRARTRKNRTKYPPTISKAFNKEVQKIFKRSLELKPERRYKDPASFFDKLSDTFLN